LAIRLTHAVVFRSTIQVRCAQPSNHPSTFRFAFSSESTVVEICGLGKLFYRMASRKI